MANMSYCRFQNTYQDFEDCKYAYLELHAGSEEEEELSTEERVAASHMLWSIADLLLSLGVDVDSEQLEQAMEQMKLKL